MLCSLTLAVQVSERSLSWLDLFHSDVHYAWLVL